MQRQLTFTRGEDPSPLASVADVAWRIGVPRDTVQHWIWRGLGTPEPVAIVATGALYWWPDWVEWVRVNRPKVYEAMGNGQTLDSDEKGAVDEAD